MHFKPHYLFLVGKIAFFFFVDVHFDLHILIFGKSLMSDDAMSQVLGRSPVQLFAGQFLIS